MKMLFWRVVHSTTAAVVAASLFAAETAAASPRPQALVAILAAGQQSSLDLPEEAEEAPLKSPPKSLDEEEAPLNPPSNNSSGKVIPLDDFGSEEASDGDEPQDPVCDMVDAPPSEAGGTHRPRQVKLLTEWLKLPLPPNATYELHELNSTGKGSRPFTVKGNQVFRVEYYEERMLKKAAVEFFPNDNDAVVKLSRPNAVFDLADAEQRSRGARIEAILKLALAEHDSAVQRFLRPRKDWATNLRRPLAQALLNIEVSQIRRMVRSGQTEQAAAECDRIRAQLAGGAMGQVELQSIYEDIYLKPAIEAGKQRDYATTRSYLNEYTARFPQKPGKLADDIRSALVQRAQLTVTQAQEQTDPRERVRLLEEAGKIWPQLIGLDNQLRQVQEDYPVLEIAYTTLPKNLSPLNMSTPVERHAAALLFESLVQWTEQSPAGPHYASQLAQSRPAPLARGRRFRLPQCGWSDTEPGEPHLCTAEDIRWTLDVYRKVHPAGFPPAWDRLVQGVQSNDPFAVSLNLQVDHWQPLSLMDFMILPRRYFPTKGADSKELAAFAANPVGTGPYRLLSRDETTVRFQANPTYRRAEEGLPYIREISFRRMEPLEAADEFRNGKIHIIYGVPREHVDQLERQGKKVVALPARSVYFLAPNYRKPSSILQLTEVRLAIAHAINRKQILDQFFRPGQHPTRHAELNGPFPVNSWAYNPQAPKFDPAQAAVQLRNVKERVAAAPKLKLVYPGRDIDAELACQEIAKQVLPLGIELTLEAVEPHLFYDQVTRQQNFDLAYWRHDFDDETYWIWPLFDPEDAAPGGANFMGIMPDDGLRAPLADMLKHKEFTRIRTLAHQAHVEIARSAAIIPLWQLETHVAVSPLVRDAVFDPVYLFEDVEHWRLER